MRNKFTYTFTLILMLSILPIVSADTIIPTKTKVYFEQNGQPYNTSLDFVVKGYGYRTGMPGSIGFNPDRKSGTYTPKVVYSFSAAYRIYGDEIDENYYQNYLHIDYYELEGKTLDGKHFIVTNISSIPTQCIERSDSEYELNCELQINLDTADWNFKPSPSKPQGFWNRVSCFFKRSC